MVGGGRRRGVGEPDFWGLLGRPGMMDRIGFGNRIPSFEAKEKKKKTKDNTRRSIVLPGK